MKFADGILGDIQRHHVIEVGSVKTFFDGHEALICTLCQPKIVEYFRLNLSKYDDKNIPYYYPVGTGASGMAIIQLLGFGAYITPIDKPGPTIRGEKWVLYNKDNIALVDDCITQGWTMDYMTSVLARRGITPVKEIVLMGARPDVSVA